jgi:pre-rRNA-processing protein TSR3
MISTTIIRHWKENLAKCSLRGLEERPDLTFVPAYEGMIFPADGFLLLTVDAPPLDPDDPALSPRPPLLLLDATWRLAPLLERMLRGSPLRRSLPAGWVGAYPRRSKLFCDPGEGLATVEALYAARLMLGDEQPGLLEHYRWAEDFRRLNTRRIAFYRPN